MEWMLGALGLLVTAVVLRRILQLDKGEAQSVRGLAPLTAERTDLYQPIALELETQAAILGISLNDAFEERDSGHLETAWRLVGLAAGEWHRLAGSVNELLNILSRHSSDTRVVLPRRSITPHRFKSQAMIDYARMHEFVDQLVFRSKVRFELHLRVLRRAVETLSGEFHRTVQYAERTEDWPPEVWSKLDLCFHDFDLITKETLLAFRSFLCYLPHPALPQFSAELRDLVRRGVRAPSVGTER